MKKFLLVLVGLFAFPNSICALTCIADCTLMEGTETGTYCACGGWVDFGSRYGCPRKLYNPITGTCESCNPSEYSCDLGSYNENRIVGYSAQPCSSVIEGCSQCYGTRTCSSCQSGYTLSNGKCISGSESESEGGMVSCPVGQYLSGKKCVDCSTIPVQNGTCSACSSDGTCTNATCDKGYAYNASTSACTPVVTCKPPLKFSADYSGDCDGCCVE